MGRSSLALVLALAACSPPTVKSTPVGDQVTQDTLAKLEVYFACISDLAPTVFRSAEAYRARTEATAYKVIDERACVASMNLLKMRPPVLPELTAAGDAFQQALLDLERAATTNYSDRTTMLAAFTRFEVAEGRLFDLVFDKNLSIRQQQLSEKSGDVGIELMREQLMLQAATLVRYARVPATALDRLDIENMSKALSNLDEIIEKTASFATTERSSPDVGKAGERKTSPNEIASFERLEIRARELVLVTRQLIRRSLDKVAFGPSELLQIQTGGEDKVVGTPAAVVEAFNKLVASYYAG